MWPQTYLQLRQVMYKGDDSPDMHQASRIGQLDRIFHIEYSIFGRGAENIKGWVPQKELNGQGIEEPRKRGW